jgi:hypothetical protein
MKRDLLTCSAAAGLLFAAIAPARGHDGDDDHAHPKPVAPEAAHKPSPIPDRVILGITTDPARSQSVNWRTDGSVARGIGRIAVAEDGPGFVVKAVEVTATTEPLETNLGKAHFHTIIFENLEPATDYLYQVGDGANWSEWFRFTTASAGPEPFSFIYFGDAQNDLKAHWSRVIREAFRDAPRARFLLHAGDLANRGDQDQDWGEWFYAGGWLNGMLPNVAVPGNHEYRKRTDETRELAPHWRAQFALPTNGPAGLEESCYTLDYQGARIVGLNSNERQAGQAVWLEKVLADNPNRWTIVTFHHPIYSAAKGRDNPVIRDLWQPLFDKYKVDLVLQGHDHTYARSGLVLYEENVANGARVRDGEGGTVYVVSVSGPKMYNLDREEWMHRAAEDTQLYQIISVDGDSLVYQARTATGKLYDSFSLRKRAGEVNELTDLIPVLPENRRPPLVPAVEGAAGK